VVLAAIVAAQAVALLVLLVRLMPGARRVPPVEPAPNPALNTSVTVIVPTLNEARRLAPCLAGLRRQGPPLVEILVVDSASTDGTPQMVQDAASYDARVRLLADPPLPPGWIGKMWALQHGLAHGSGEWILGIDADVEPRPGMVAAVVNAARARGLDMVSFSPCFAGQSPGQRFFHPSLALTLVYRFGAPAPSPPPGRLLANGQCFLSRRDVLLQFGGYEPARRSFADDVTLARHYARHGVRVGFLDGSRLYVVRSYESLGEMWREWGRSIALADATTSRTQAADVMMLALVQGAPLPVLLLAWFGAVDTGGVLGTALIVLNAILLAVRVALLAAIAPSYQRRGIPYWLSPLTDLAAVFRVAVSSVRRPRRWRGRNYSAVTS
jgi:dolichol-phosphate mannosyltransferase